MWQLIDDARNYEPIPGVPWDGAPIPDDRFAAIEAAYDAQFPDQPGSLRRWFTHTDTDAPARPTRSRREG